MKTYKVKSGDTLSAIAKSHKVTIANLVKWNNIKDKNKISVGQVIKLQGPTKTKVYTTKAPPHKKAHFIKPGYRVGNSNSGNDRAIKENYVWTDQDFTVSKDGVPVNTHWQDLKVDGFTSTTVFVRSCSLKYIKSLKTVDGYTIRTAPEVFAKCASIGLKVEFECKYDSRFEDPNTWKIIADQAKFAFGANWKSCVEVKTLAHGKDPLVHAKKRLKAAHSAGFTTVLLTTSSKISNQGINEDYITYWR